MQKSKITHVHKKPKYIFLTLSKQTDKWMVQGSLEPIFSFSLTNMGI